MESIADKNTSKKRAPRLKDPDMQIAMDQIWTEFSSMKDSINREVAEDDKEEESGSSGDIKVVKDGNEYRINFKTSEGWVESKDGTFQLKA